MITLKFRDILQSVPGLVDEFDNVLAKVGGLLESQHNDDGSHGDVVAESVSLQGAKVGELISLPYDARRFATYGANCTWTVDEADQIALRASRIGQLVFVQFRYETTVLAGVDTPDSLEITLPEFHMLPAISGTSPAALTGGSLLWQDVAAGTNGIGLVQAIAYNFSGTIPATSISLLRQNPASSTAQQWALSANLFVNGFCWFVTTPDNASTPFYGV